MYNQSSSCCCSCSIAGGLTAIKIYVSPSFPDQWINFS